MKKLLKQIKNGFNVFNILSISANEGGTGNRIFGDSVSQEAVTSKKQVKSRSKSGQEKLEGIQAKLNNKNLSNKRRKELKKAGRKVANEERRRAENEEAST